MKHFPLIAALAALLAACSPKLQSPSAETAVTAPNAYSPSTRTTTANYTQTAYSLVTQTSVYMTTQTVVTENTKTSVIVSTHTVTSVATQTVTSAATRTVTDVSTATVTSVSTQTYTSVVNVPAPGDPDSVANVPTALGMRNFEQINQTMQQLTGVEGNGTVVSRYNNLKGQLPGDNDIKAFAFSGQIAVTVLAAEYCNALVTNAAYATQRTAALGAVNTASPPSQALTAAGKMDVAQKLVSRFWGDGILTNPDPATALSNLVSLLGDLVAGETDNATATKKALVGACTSALASSPVIIM